MNVPVIKAEWITKFGLRGIALFLFILIHDKSDVAMIAHERVHISQQWDWRNLFIIGFVWGYWIEYLVGNSMPRLRYEAEAYAVSMKHGMTFNTAVDHLMSSVYNLGLPHKTVEAVLRSYK